MPVRLARRHDLMPRLDESIDDGRVVHRAAAFHQDGDGGFVGHAPAVGPVRRQCVVAVDDRENARTNRDGVAFDAVRIAAAIPVLVVVADDRHHRIREVDRGENLGADRGVELHLLELGRRELARFVQDVLGHRNLAGVVEQRRRFDCLQQGFVGD